MGSVSNLRFKDGDEDDTEFSAATVTVSTVSNGWILNVVDEDDNEYTEVFDFINYGELIASIREALSIE